MKKIIFILSVILLINCSNKFHKNLGKAKELDGIQIDSIKYLTYDALNIQDCNKIKKYMTSLLFTVDCSSNIESEYKILRDTFENHFKSYKLLKKRNANNCVFFENYFDAVCISSKYYNLTNFELTKELLIDIQIKKKYSTNFQPERILIGYTFSLMEVDDVVDYFNKQSLDIKDELISCFRYSENHIDFCKKILETEKDETIIFYLNAILREYQNQNKISERNNF